MTERRRRFVKKEERAALRTQLYDRATRADLGLVEAVRMMRKVAGKTQTEYAAPVGVSARVLIDFERGVGNPTVKTPEKILAPFNLELTVRRRRETEIALGSYRCGAKTQIETGPEKVHHLLLSEARHQERRVDRPVEIVAGCKEPRQFFARVSNWQCRGAP